MTAEGDEKAQEPEGEVGKPSVSAKAAKKADKIQAPDDDEFPLLQAAKVLVVDDSAPMRMMVTKTISRIAQTVDSASDGAEGLRKLREVANTAKPHHLVFLDLMMPGMSGLKMLEHLRSDPDLKTLNVVVVSAKNSREDILACAHFGIEGYILKPFKTHLILEAGEKALTPPEPQEEAKGDGEAEKNSADAEGTKDANAKATEATADDDQNAEIEETKAQDEATEKEDNGDTPSSTP